MATMNISIPDEMKAFVAEQAAKSGFGTVSEYMRVLIRGVQERQAEAQMCGCLAACWAGLGTSDPAGSGRLGIDSAGSSQAARRTPGTDPWLERLRGSSGILRQFSILLSCGKIETAGRGHVPCCGAGIW